MKPRSKSARFGTGRVCRGLTDHALRQWEVIEFVTREDPMVTLLLRNKEDQYFDYDLTHFETGLGSRFLVERREPLGSGTRVLYHARSTNRV